MLGLSALAALGQTSKQPDLANFDEEKEKSLILGLLNKQIEISFKGDYEIVKGYFIKSNYSFRANNSANITFNAKVGSRAIDEYYDNAKQRNTIQQGSSNYPRVERRNFIWKFFNAELTFVIWDQYNSDKEIKMFTHSEETRLMEKHNDTWKIVSYASYWDYKNLIPVESLK